MSEITYETFPDILFSDVGNSSIRYFDHSLTYNEAKDYCQSYYNSTLVEFWSELDWTQVTEEHFTKKLKPLKEGNSIQIIAPFQITQWITSPEIYFIGLHDLDNEGDFVWESGRQLAAEVAAHWRSGQPDNHLLNDHCVVVREGEMYDYPCDNYLKFVCQKRH